MSNETEPQLLNTHSSVLNTIIMKTLLFLLITLTIILITTVVVTAQPGLPTAPSQAPIDGGLGLLAAAGGAYALKKLRDKNKGEEELE